MHLICKLKRSDRIVVSVDDMGYGKSLSDFEKGQIIAYQENGLSERQIAFKIRRSKTLIHNFLRDPNGYGKKKAVDIPLSLVIIVSDRSYGRQQLPMHHLPASHHHSSYPCVLEQSEMCYKPLRTTSMSK